MHPACDKLSKIDTYKNEEFLLCLLNEIPMLLKLPAYTAAFRCSK